MRQLRESLINKITIKHIKWSIKLDDLDSNKLYIYIPDHKFLQINSTNFSFGDYDYKGNQSYVGYGRSIKEYLKSENYEGNIKVYELKSGLVYYYQVQEFLDHTSNKELEKYFVGTLIIKKN